MATLDMNLFARAADDVERTQYQILGGLQHARRDFAAKRIYPHLGRLVALYTSLRTILKQSDAYRTASAGTATGIDWEEGTLQYRWPELEDGELSTVRALIEWALPRIQEAIEEGRSIYEMVEENFDVETVGIMPSYVKEGYVLVPDRKADRLHVLRYTVSIFTNEDEQYRTLKTEHCKSIDQFGVDAHPSSVKLEMVDERKDLPNPATYMFNTDLDFPYEPTLLPVAKRTLMRHLAQERDWA